MANVIDTGFVEVDGEGSEEHVLFESEKADVAGNSFDRDRQPDLTGDNRRPVKRKLKGLILTSTEPEHQVGLGNLHSNMEEGSQQPTQEATQPVDDPRRQGKNLSEMSADDVTDIICVLHPNSKAAFTAVRATMLAACEHILQNEDLDGVTEEHLELYPDLEKKQRDIALRMNSTVKSPTDGFRFGRNPSVCDVLLTDNTHDKLVSNVHFKIFVNSHGSLMLQDHSTNGTIVDDEHLHARDRTGRPAPKPAMRALKNGDIVSVIGEPNHQEIKFMIRIPNRTGNEGLYEGKLRKYLAIRGKTARFSSMRETQFGNHWTGGSMYNFTGLLGKGAFALVYRVQTKNDGTVFAAKEIDKRRFLKNGVLDLKFDSELKIMRNLKHPNIVDYIDCQSYENWIYIIMEYVPCGELAKELQKRKFMVETEVQQITKQTLYALEYLHSRGIVHRDIKPDNILIASKDPLVVKLSDFGLSKCVADQETFLKTFCGTLLYCAPEIYPDYSRYIQQPIKRRRYGEPTPKTTNYDHKVDMWSFGAVIFHLLCGKAPILGRGDDRGAQMLSNIMTKEIDFSPLRSLGVSELAISFVRQLLNRNPMLRPSERECFHHQWLRTVPDVCGYEDLAMEDAPISRQLTAVQEVDEDEADQQLMSDLYNLTQDNRAVIPDSSPDDARSPRVVKKPRMFTEESTIPENILYPNLPQASSGVLPYVDEPAAGGRLFGEITPSVLKSSGLFGHEMGPNVGVDVQQIRTGMGQISVNDYGAYNESHVNQPGADVSGQPLQYPHTLNMPDVVSGAAPSLLGAEIQIGQLNMGSPDVTLCDLATSSETTNPVTPKTRELSPSSSSSEVRSSAVQPASQELDDDLRKRLVRPSQIKDHESFSETLKQRQVQREANADMIRKAETFHAQTGNDRPIGSSIELARTIDVRTGQEVRRTETTAFTDFEISPTRLIDRQKYPRKSIQRPERYGVLTPIPGSFVQQSIDLGLRNNLWGRGPVCSVQYPDLLDTRIPKIALKITFWAPGIEEFERSGGDWTQYPGIRTLISTGTNGVIYVNGVALRRETPNGTAGLFGRLYSGDLITVFDEGGCFAKFEVEILFGDGARRRPEQEKEFIVEKEVRNYLRYIERTSTGSKAA